jgi:hypothetical protein
VVEDGKEIGLSIEMKSIFILNSSNFPSESTDDLTGGMLMVDCKSEEGDDPVHCSSPELYLSTCAKEEFVL